MTREGANILIAAEMDHYHRARTNGDVEAAWAALERAHIVSQPYLGPHVANHVAMLRFSLALRDGGEALGQMFRIALAPLGALTGRIPVGNTGRANVSAFQPMPIEPELQARMDKTEA